MAISQDGSMKYFSVICRIDTPNEVDYYKHDGILQYVLRSLLKQDRPIVEQETKLIAESETQKYRILFKGEIEEGQELETVKERLTQLFKTSPERIEKLFTGKTVTLNRNIDFAKAQEYSDELKNAGALCIIDPMPKIPPASNTIGAEPSPSHSASKVEYAPASHLISSKKNDSTKSVEPPAIHAQSKTLSSKNIYAAKAPARPTKQFKSNFLSLKNFDVTTVINQLSFYFKSFSSGWMWAVVGMILLPLLYLFLLFFIASTTIDHIWDNMSLIQ